MDSILQIKFQDGRIVELGQIISTDVKNEIINVTGSNCRYVASFSPYADYTFRIKTISDEQAENNKDSTAYDIDPIEWENLLEGVNDNESE